jgi:putative transcriptional regulator
MKNNLKQIRTEKGLTQEAVARELQVSTRMYQYLEAGKAEPRISQAVKIANFLGTSLERLFDFQE